MIFENKFRKFLVEDNSLLSNILLSTTSTEVDHIKQVDEKISFKKIEEKVEKPKTEESADKSKKALVNAAIEDILDKAKDIAQKISDPWNAKGRVVVNPGKFINLVLKDKEVLGDTIKTADIEQWVNRYKSYFTDNSELKIVSGDEILYHYNSRNYTDKRGGSLWSCMSGNECQDRLDLYSKNPETVQLVVQYDEKKKVKSRALLWTLLDGNKMMDRIYYSEDKSVNTYKRLAEDNKWVIRDNGLKDAVKSPIKQWAHQKYPYLDTMRLMDKDDATGQYYITNGSIPSDRDYIIPNGTAGYTINNHVRIGSKWYPQSEAGYCGISGKGMLIKDLTEVPRYGKIENTLVDNDKWGKSFYKDDLVTSEIMKGKLSKQSAYQLKDSKDWIGRKKYRSYVTKGKLTDGSATYKNKVIWVLDENVTKKTDLETKIKTDLATRLSELKKPVKEEELEKFSVTKLRDLYNSYSKKKYKSDEFAEWESWVIYKIEDDSKEEKRVRKARPNNYYNAEDLIDDIDDNDDEF